MDKYNMQREKITITKKESKDNEKYKTISLWMDSEMILKIEEIAHKANSSSDEIINLFIEYGLDNYKRE